ncbi:hypothetical protein LTR94_036709, partial [Friedmanniomyces endolithicus]
ACSKRPPANYARWSPLSISSSAPAASPKALSWASPTPTASWSAPANAIAAQKRPGRPKQS